MKVVIEYQGKTYESEETSEKSAEEIAEMFYENFSDMTKLKFKQKDGSVFLIGERALQSAVIMFLP